jgi:hypothetical protein
MVVVFGCRAGSHRTKLFLLGGFATARSSLNAVILGSADGARSRRLGRLTALFASSAASRQTCVASWLSSVVQTATAPAYGSGPTITGGWHCAGRIWTEQQVRQYVNGLHTSTTATIATGSWSIQVGLAVLRQPGAR